MENGRDSPNNGEKTAKNDGVSMNEELQKWLNKTREETKISKKMKGASNVGRKRPSGKCQICGEKDAKFVCLKCGRSVCISCYFKIIGVCKKCVPKSIVEKWDEKHPDWEKVLGVDWVD